MGDRAGQAQGRAWGVLSGPSQKGPGTGGSGGSHAAEAQGGLPRAVRVGGARPCPWPRPRAPPPRRQDCPHPLLSCDPGLSEAGAEPKPQFPGVSPTAGRTKGLVFLAPALLTHSSLPPDSWFHQKAAGASGAPPPVPRGSASGRGGPSPRGPGCPRPARPTCPWPTSVSPPMLLPGTPVAAAWDPFFWTDNSRHPGLSCVARGGN